MTKTVVFDLEIQKAIVPPAEQASAQERERVERREAVHGWANAHTAGIASGVAYWAERDRYFIFGERREEHNDLAGLLQGADRVVGFNHWRFDYPLLAHTLGIERAELTDEAAAPGERDIDLLQMLWAAYRGRAGGKGLSLDAVSRNTLGPLAGGKAGAGAMATLLYQGGRYGELLNYNLRDVELTAALWQFIRRHGYAIAGQAKYPIHPIHPKEWL